MAITFPLSMDDSNVIELKDLEEEVRNKIQMSLLTDKGERIGFPDFGCEIEKIRYAPLEGNLTTSLAIQFTQEALVKDVPEIDVTEVTVEFDEQKRIQDPEAIIISVKYKNLLTGSIDNTLTQLI